MDPFKKRAKELTYDDIRKIYRRRVMEQGIRLSSVTPEDFYEQWEKSSFFDRIPLIPGNSESFIVYDTNFIKKGLTLEQATFVNLILETCEHCGYDDEEAKIEFCIYPVSIVLDLVQNSKSKMEELLKACVKNGIRVVMNNDKTMFAFEVFFKK